LTKVDINISMSSSYFSWAIWRSNSNCMCSTSW